MPLFTRPYVPPAFDLGLWTNVPYNAGDFTANGSMIWTVSSFTAFRYYEIGKTMWISFFSFDTVISGTANYELRIKVPNGRTIAGKAIDMVMITNQTPPVGIWVATAGNTYLQLFINLLSPNWAINSLAVAFVAQIEVV